ncbi:platelet-derived growth factor receptor-like protein [Synchiropus splendidus]|uniref:platelet-derived growth factor receptor-like protein n=1 Tax=Synchiropus splendidus TaxID=270530 RepID=UPI00237E3DA5|nr:platelet-derived growth factor receptor-like protein [Synchiropus splendidus]
MKLWLLLCLLLLWNELQKGVCQQAKRRKDSGENRIRPGGKRVKLRQPKLKEGGGRGPSLLTQVLEKGSFLRLGASATLSPGKNLELRCKGSKIGWSYPAYLDTFNDSRLSIRQSDKYGQLVLTSPSAADSGPYSCWVILCDGAECAKDHQQAYVTYIYFKDKDNLFVPSAIHFEIIYLRPDKPATVPCRVTDPLAKVTLHREVPPEELPSNGTEVTYDPMKGFILKSPSSRQQGVFYCKAVTRGTPQISTKFQLLYVEVPSSPPFVSMEAPSRVNGADNINVTCKAVGEPEGEVTFTWSYPGQGSRPVHIQTTWRLVSRGRGHLIRITQSILRVEDMETIDFGSYACRARNQHGETIMTTRVSPM